MTTLAERIDAARERANAAWEALCAMTVPRLAWGPVEARGAYLKAAREVEGLISERERGPTREEAVAPEVLAEWRRVTEAASPGPWDYGYPDYDRDDNWSSHKRDPYSERGGFHIVGANHDILRGKGIVAGKWDYESGGILTEPDAAFIAAARTAMPALLDEIGRLQRELAEAQRTIRGYEAVLTPRDP